MNGFHVDLHAFIEGINTLYHDLLYKTYFWESSNKIWVRIVIIYVENEQFDVHVTLSVTCRVLNSNQSQNNFKYRQMGNQIIYNCSNK